ncbi:MAG: serine hydrolase [Alphaproteobacteria bacterium]|nr:serine hydrolase [Alphaproteobacteria bacterium]
MGTDWTPAARTEDMHYALGWFTADVRGVHIVFHNGANPGFRAAIVLAPSAKAGVVVLTNGEADQFTRAATQSLLKQLLQ